MATVDATVSRPRRRRSGLTERRLAALMISPSLLVILLVAAYPIGYAVYLSRNE
jgi:ABC-type sugar transport system permease subunit